jgi:membrane-associated phospholipid phosphatase
MLRLPRLVPTALLCLACCTTAHAQTQTKQDEDTGVIRRWGTDAKAYVTAPLHAGRSQWVKFASTVGVIAFAYQHDDDVRARFVPEGTPPPATNNTHGTADALPGVIALGGTWLAARAASDRDGRREAGTMFEAAVFASLSTEVLKKVAGRERPFVSGDKSGFGEGGSSFPSGHVSAAFAIGAVLAESGNDRQRWLRRILGYGVGAITAYERMNHDQHWFSDTVAGAGVGIATARFLMKRHDPNSTRSFAVVPTHDGVAVSFAAVLR